MPSRRLLIFAIVSLLASALFAQESRLRTRPQGPPALPLPAPFASRGAMLGSQQWKRVAQDTTDPNQQTVMLPLSAGITLISIPLRTDSQRLSDLLRNLPNGSRVWRWDATNQEFVEGFDQELPFGEGAVLYVPSPVVVAVTGTADLSPEVPVDLQKGWNLVGVPFDVPLPRSAQNVYVDSIRTPFNDAVNNGDLGASVFSLDIRGDQPVGENDSLEPMNAYWVNSQNANLLELQPQLLQGIEADFAIWAAKSIGSAGLNFLAGQLFKAINGDPTQQIINQLGTISSQISDIQTTLEKMNDQQAAAALAINLQLSKIMTTVQEQALDAVDADLATHLRKPTFKDSMQWFIVNQTKSVDQLKAADPNDRIQFSLRVIEQYNILTDFNVVENRVLGLDGTGILDNFINNIFITNANDKQQEDQYRAMESYFTRMIGLQVQCAILIENAYQQLANSAQYGSKYAGAADDFQNNIYVPTIRREAAKFQSLVETLMSRGLTIPTTPDQPPVGISNDFRLTILTRMDFMLMNLLGQPAGLRVHLLVSPDMNPDNPYRIRTGVPGSGRFSTATLPSTATACQDTSKDAGDAALAQNCWRRLSGPANYDSWRRLPGNPSYAEFFITKDWLLIQTTASVTPGTETLVLADDALSLFDVRSPYQTITLSTMGMDSRGNLVPSSSGTLFGSVLIATRATADSMLHVPPSTASFSGQCSGTYVAPYQDFINMANCGKNFARYETYKGFMYCQTCTGNAKGNFGFGVQFVVQGNVGRSYGYSQLYCGCQQTQISNSTSNNNGVASTYTSVSWQPGQLYALKIGLYWAPGVMGDVWPTNLTAFRRNGVFMSFP